MYGEEFRRNEKNCTVFIVPFQIKLIKTKAELYDLTSLYSAIMAKRRYWGEIGSYMHCKLYQCSFWSSRRIFFHDQPMWEKLYGISSHSPCLLGSVESMLSYSFFFLLPRLKTPSSSINEGVIPTDEGKGMTRAHDKSVTFLIVWYVHWDRERGENGPGLERDRTYTMDRALLLQDCKCITSYSKVEQHVARFRLLSNHVKVPDIFAVGCGEGLATRFGVISKFGMVYDT